MGVQARSVHKRDAVYKQGWAKRDAVFKQGWALVLNRAFITRGDVERHTDDAHITPEQLYLCEWAGGHA
jgi:hypothetical protein